MPRLEPTSLFKHPERLQLRIFAVLYSGVNPNARQTPRQRGGLPPRRRGDQVPLDKGAFCIWEHTEDGRLFYAEAAAYGEENLFAYHQSLSDLNPLNKMTLEDFKTSFRTWRRLNFVGPEQGFELTDKVEAQLACYL